MLYPQKGGGQVQPTYLLTLLSYTYPLLCLIYLWTGQFIGQFCKKNIHCWQYTT